MQVDLILISKQDPYSLILQNCFRMILRLSQLSHGCHTTERWGEVSSCLEIPVVQVSLVTLSTCHKSHDDVSLRRWESHCHSGERGRVSPRMSQTGLRVAVEPYFLVMVRMSPDSAKIWTGARDLSRTGIIFRGSQPVSPGAYYYRQMATRSSENAARLRHGAHLPRSSGSLVTAIIGAHNKLHRAEEKQIALPDKWGETGPDSTKHFSERHHAMTQLRHNSSWGCIFLLTDRSWWTWHWGLWSSRPLAQDSSRLS